METSFSQLKEKEIINLDDGKKMGRIIDIVFDNQTGRVQGILLPGDRKLFHKADDIFVPLQNLRKIGDDVILIRYLTSTNILNYSSQTQKKANYTQPQYEKVENSGYNSNFPKSFVRYRRINNNKYN